MLEPTKDELELLHWLAKEDISHFGECNGRTLDNCVLNNWVAISDMRVSLTTKGQELLLKHREEPRNTGHGHVHPRPDGLKMRCGGPGICAECSKEAAMVKQFRSDGTEIRDGESTVPGYTPLHLRPAVEEGASAPPAETPEFRWWEDPIPDPEPDWIPELRPELVAGMVDDPGEAVITPTLTYLQASENNIDRVVNLVQSHLCHDQDYKPLTPREQVSVLILAVNRIVWQDMQSKPKE